MSAPKTSPGREEARGGAEGSPPTPDEQAEPSPSTPGPQFMEAHSAIRGVAENVVYGVDKWRWQPCALVTPVKWLLLTLSLIQEKARQEALVGRD